MSTHSTARHDRLRFTRTATWLTALAAALGATALSLAAPQSGKSKEDRTAEKSLREREKADKERARERSKWMDRLEREDRAALDENLDFALPTWTAGLDWVGEAKAPSFDEMRGRVIVIQTFSTKGNAGRSIVDKLAKELAEYKPEDVRLIAIHTPEGSDKAEAVLGKTDWSFPVAIDRDGGFCDAIGAFKRPINLVVNRTGDVKFAGLTLDGVRNAVKELVAEPFEATSVPNARKPQTTKSPKPFPTYTTPVQSAIDLRGKQAPGMGKVEWWNGQPSLQGKLVIVDFWATWCGPCKKAIPHMNEIAQAFRRDIACVGISDESNADFTVGLAQSSLSQNSFQYAVGIDPTATMKKAFAISGIPHAVVISSDGIVRWQGHPASLDRETVNELVEANRALLAVRGESTSDRWRQALESEKERSGGSREKSRR